MTHKHTVRIIGFLSSFIGGIVGLAVLAMLNQGGIAATPVIHDENYQFQIGKGEVIQDGSNRRQ